MVAMRARDREKDRGGGNFSILVAAIGRDSALKIAAAKGGLTMWIPSPGKRIAADHWLVQTIGADASQALTNEIGGGLFSIPSARVRRRHDAIIAELIQGRSVRQIALSLGINERTVRRHKPSARELARLRAQAGEVDRATA